MPRPRRGAPRPVRIERAGRRRVIVHVTGAVRRPGVYRSPRLGAARPRREARGRRRERAPTSRASIWRRKVADGQQVVVPRRVRRRRARGWRPRRGGRRLAPPVSLNTATPEQLDQLEGVGPATAQKILEWRKEHGGFRRWTT